MKERSLLSILFLVFILNTFAQNRMQKELESIDTTLWLCSYKYDFRIDSMDSNSMKNDQMVLQIGSHHSKFSSIANFILDSILYLSQGKKLEPAMILELTSRSVSGVNGNLMTMYKIYKNYPGPGRMIFTDYDDHKFYKVEEPLQIKWKLDGSKDTVILGYTCHRALTAFAGRTYIAWYSLSIPINEGPYKFNGLPGLILKISDTQRQHSFTINSFKRTLYNQSITLRTGSFVDISASEYIKMMNNKMSRLYGRLLNGTISFSDEESKAKLMHGLKRKNNFIEKL